MCEVEKEYFEEFNLNNLRERFTNFNKALDIIMDYDSQENSTDDLSRIDVDAKKKAREEAP